MLIRPETLEPIFRFGHHYDDVTDAEDGADVLELIVMLSLLVPILATGARRLNSGKTGWWQLFVLIPFAGWLVLIIFFFCAASRTKIACPPPV